MQCGIFWWCAKMFLNEAQNILPCGQGPMWRHQMFFQMLYSFVQMVLIIYSINMGGFWRMEMINWVKDFKQMILIKNVAKRFTITPNLIVKPKCTTFEAFTTTGTIYFLQEWWNYNIVQNWIFWPHSIKLIFLHGLLNFFNNSNVNCTFVHILLWIV